MALLAHPLLPSAAAAATAATDAAVVVVVAAAAADCPVFGFVYSSDEKDLLLQQQTESWASCAVICNKSAAAAAPAAAAAGAAPTATAAAAAAAGGCGYFVFNSFNSLCRLFAAAAPPVGFESPFGVSGQPQTLIAASSCSASFLLSPWSDWRPFSPQGDTPAAAAAYKTNY